MSEKRDKTSITRLDEHRQQSAAKARQAALLAELAEESGASATRRTTFLVAWKDGVELIGASYFNVESDSVAQATDRDQLRPDFETIQRALPGMSSGQQRFLIALCQFFSDTGIAELCREAEISVPSLADLALLDRARRSVITRLIDSYTGW